METSILASGMTGTPEHHFPSDYRSARAAFVAAAEKAGLGVTARVHPSEKGRDGKPLFLDVAAAGPREAKIALLLISATHGVEGYFGSGVETGLLREGIANRVPDGVRLVMLHALNPYGFSWDRRVDETNTDVNRNFVDHAHPPVNEEYARLADAFAPADIGPETMKAADAVLRSYRRAHGSFALQAALSSGQYAYPDGLYFGGAHESWSAAMLKDVFGEEFAHVERLVAIDFHTGLGETGAAEMIVETPPGSAPYLDAKKLWGEHVRSSRGNESLSAPLTGTVDEAMARWMGARELVFAALEVGTRPVRDVLDALRRDNWLHRYGGLARAEAEVIKRDIRAAFYPDTVEWKRKVWSHAHDAVMKALAAIA